MNQVIITNCNECWEWYPATSYGNGNYCDAADKVVNHTVEEGIPDWCPKLKGVEK